MINFRGNMESLAYKERKHDHYFVRENKPVIIRIGDECANSEMKECIETYVCFHSCCLRPTASSSCDEKTTPSGSSPPVS